MPRSAEAVGQGFGFVFITAGDSDNAHPGGLQGVSQGRADCACSDYGNRVSANDRFHTQKLIRVEVEPW